MARADREAVLRGVNARFDEENDDDAVIAALGSPTFAAVSVLRGYTPPENPDGEDYYEEEETYQYVEPSAAPSVEEPSAPEADADSEEPGLVAPEETPDTLTDAAEELNNSGATAGADEEAPDAHEAEADEPTALDEPDLAGQAVEEPDNSDTSEPVNDAPEAEAGEPEDLSPGQAAPEADVEPLSDEAADAQAEIESESEAESVPEEPDEPVDTEESSAPDSPVTQSGHSFETIDLGLDTIEVYSDTPESAPDEPDTETGSEFEPEYAPEYGSEPESVSTAPENVEAVEYDDEVGSESQEEENVYPEPYKAERPKMRGGRVFACVLLGLIPGVPVAAFLVLLSLALLVTGAALVYVGGVCISFTFLGMGVVADILLTAGFGLVVAAIGLPIIFFAIWFFIRCVVGLFNNIFDRAGAWCRGEEREQ